MIILIRSVIIVAVLVLRFNHSEATPCDPSNYLEIKTNCINDYQTSTTFEKQDSSCTGEASITAACSLKKASLSDRCNALLDDIAGLIISGQVLYHFDKDVGVIGYGRKSIGVQAMYTNGEQLGSLAYSFRDVLKAILAPISIFTYPISGILLHDLLMGTDVYYIGQQPHHSIIHHETQEPKETFLTRILDLIPYWNSPLSSYVEEYFLMTRHGMLLLFIIRMLIVKADDSPLLSNELKLLITVIVHVALSVAYLMLFLYNFYHYSFKNAYWFYILCHLDSLFGNSSARKQAIMWYILLRNEESFCNEAWLLLSVYCATNLTILWMKTQSRTIMWLFLVCRLLEFACVLYRFISHTSNLVIILPILSELPGIYWIIALMARDYIPVRACFLICFALCLLQHYSKLFLWLISSNKVKLTEPNVVDTLTNGKLVGGHWLRDNPKTTPFINHLTKSKQNDDYDSDEDSTYEESQATYESSYDDSSLSTEEAD